MKIKYRIISLLLTFSLLFTGVYVTGALADTTQTLGGEQEAKVPVGSYTAPLGAWDPTAGENATTYAGIVFAAWESEADFLSGTAPAKWWKSGDYLSNDTVGSNAAVKYAYIHLFADASTKPGDQLYLADKQSLTINLGGHKLTASAGIRVGITSHLVYNTYLKIMNGTFVHTGGQMHTRPGITRIFENVVYNSSTNCLAYDNGAALLEYKNCEVNLSDASAIFTLAVFNGVESRLNLIGTKVVQTARASTSLIRVSTPSGCDATSSWTFFFDGQSSIERQSGVSLFTFSHGFTPVYKDANNTQLADTQTCYNFAKNNTIIYEPGFVISEDALVDDYRENNYNGSIGKYYGAESIVAYNESSPILKQIMYKTGTAFEINMMVSSRDDGMYEYIASPTQETKWSPATADDGVDYTGITYAVWKNEADYLLGKTPVAWYTDSTLSSKNVGTTDNDGSSFAYSYTPGYVQAYANLTTQGYGITSGQVVTGTEQKLVIDLGGYTLDDSQGFRIGGVSASHPNASLTIRNGVYNYKNGQLQTRPETTLILECLTINVTRSREIIYDGGASLIRIKDCSIYSSSKDNHIHLSGGTASGYSKFEVINSSFNYTVTPEPGMFKIAQGYSAGYLADWEISFDKTSSVSGPVAVFVNLEETYNFAHSSSHQYYDQKGQFTQTQKIKFEEGVTFGGGAEMPTTYLYTALDVDASEAQSLAATNANATTLSCGCKAPVTKTVYTQSVKNANDSNCVITTSSEPVCVHEDKDDDTKCDLCGEDFDDGPNAPVCVHVDKDDDTKCDLCGEDFDDGIEPPPPCNHADKNDDFKCDACGETYSDGDEPVTYPTVDYSDKGKYTAPEGAWVPDGNYSGISYGVWKAEGDYLSGKAPDYWYTDGKLTSARIGTTDSNGTKYENDYVAGYVHLFKNVENTSGQIITGDSQKLVINLAGFTVEDTSGYRIGGSSATHPNASLTIKNGTLHLSGSSHMIQPRYDVTLIYDNVVMIVDFTNGSKNLFYGDCADLTLFRNCVVINNTGLNFFISTSFEDKGTARSEFRFENTELVYTVRPHGPVFDIRESTYGTCYWDFYFDKDSAIIGDIEALFKLSEEHSGGKHYPFKNTQNVYIEEGFTASFGCMPDFSCLYSTKDDLGLADPIKLLASGAEGSIFNMILVNPDTNKPLRECYAIESELGYSLFGSVPDGEYSYRYAINGGKINVVRLKRTNDKGDAIFTCRELREIPENAVITFLCDLTYDRQGSPNADGRVIGYNSGLVFDLNGKTLYFSGYRWDVTGNLAFKNGTIEVIDTNNYVFHGNPGNNAILLFENVTFNVSFAEGYIGIAAVELYSGILKIISSEVNIDGPAVLVQFTDTVRHNLLVKDSSIKAGSLVLTKYTSGLTDSYTVTGSLIDLSGAMLVFDGSYSGRGDTIAVSITSSSVKSNGIVSATGSLTSAIYTLLLSEVFLTAEPVLADTVGTVSIAGGERIMPVSGNGFAYRVTVPKASFKANLLLESNFGVRFFIPEGTNIVSLEIGGILYTVADLTDIIDYDGVVYKLITVKNIGPVNAADSFALNVVFEKDGVLHTVNSSYSVIDYISTLLETDYSTVIKRLAVSCADYIAAAYVYEGKVSPELTALLESATYLANKPQVFTPGNVTTDLGALDTAISGVQLDLGSEMKIRFNFNSAYSGTLTVMDKTYEVAGGKVGEFDYVEVTMPAHELYDTVIVITADGACGTYSLTQYVTSKVVTEGTEALKNLISAFYTYCGMADTYYNAANIE